MDCLREMAVFLGIVVVRMDCQREMVCFMGIVLGQDGLSERDGSFLRNSRCQKGYSERDGRSDGNTGVYQIGQMFRERVDLLPYCLTITARDLLDLIAGQYFGIGIELTYIFGTVGPIQKMYHRKAGKMGPGLTCTTSLSFGLYPIVMV